MQILYLRLEELSNDPYINVVHELMYDSEMEYFKDYAAGTLTQNMLRTHEGK